LSEDLEVLILESTETVVLPALPVLVESVDDELLDAATGAIESSGKRRIAKRACFLVIAAARTRPGLSWEASAILATSGSNY
jgi:hypothetical protein